MHGGWNYFAMCTISSVPGLLASICSNPTYRYVTYAACGWIETAITRNNQRHGALRVGAALAAASYHQQGGTENDLLPGPWQDYATVSLLAMGGAYFTNWAMTYLNYTTRIVFKSCRVLPVMGFRTLVVGQRYSVQQYCAGLLLVFGIALFTMGDAEGLPNFHGAGVALISVALVSVLFLTGESVEMT